MTKIKLPPLPQKKRQMLCAMCGHQGATEAAAPHAPCESTTRCEYMAFVNEVPYSDDEVRALQLETARVVLEAAAKFTEQGGGFRAEILANAIRALEFKRHE
jgi:hypothetical protein